MLKKFLTSTYLSHLITLLMLVIYSITEKQESLTIIAFVVLVILLCIKIILKIKRVMDNQLRQALSLIIKLLLLGSAFTFNDLHIQRFFVLGSLVQASLKSHKIQNQIKLIENLLLLSFTFFYLLIWATQTKQNIIQYSFLALFIVSLCIKCIIQYRNEQSFNKKEDVPKDEILNQQFLSPPQSKIMSVRLRDYSTVRQKDNSLQSFKFQKQQSAQVKAKLTPPTQAKEADMELLTNEFLRKIFNSYPDGIVVMTQDRKLIFTSLSLKRMMFANTKREATDRLMTLKNMANHLQEQEKFLQLFKISPFHRQEKDQFQYQKSQQQEESYEIENEKDQLQEDDEDDIAEFQFNLTQSFSSYENVKSQLEFILKDLEKEEEQTIRQQFENQPDSIANSKDKEGLTFQYEARMICELGAEMLRSSSNISHTNKIFNDANSYTITSTKLRRKPVYQISFKPFIKNGKGYVLLLVKDVTMFNQIRVLQAINHNKTQMLSQVAHEFRTPLNCIILMIQALIPYSDEDILKKFIEPTISSAQQLLSLVNDLLDISMLKAGKFKLTHFEFDLYKLIDDVRYVMFFQTSPKNIQLIVNIQAGTSRKIISDGNRLRQILINLIGNAVKFTQNGNIILTAKNINSDQIEISVADTGTGISQTNQQKLFKQFGKLEDPNNINLQGVGLGLMISNILAKRLGGPNNDSGLEVSSDGEGKGSKFRFVIFDHGKGQIQEEEFLLEESPQKQNSKPLTLTSIDNNCKKKNDYKQEELFKVQRHIFSNPVQTMIRQADSYQGFSDVDNTIRTGSHQVLQNDQVRIFENPYLFSSLCNCPELLIVDDIPFNIIALSSCLEKYKLKIESAFSGQEAIQKVDTFKTQYKCQIILMDIEMPLMDGLEATQRILQLAEKQKVRIVIIGHSGHAEDREKQKCLRSGMKGYYIKPIEIESLLQIIIEEKERLEE